MRFYATRNPLRALNYGRAAQMQSPAPIFLAAPRIVREPLVFPYQAGLDWADYLYQRGGWPALSQAFTDLPQSSEQILHPEKYVARETPVTVELPDLSKQLGTGWRRTWSDVRGEFGYSLLLDEFVREEAVSRAAAAGWGGDRYALYENSKSGQVAVAQVSVWDTERDAREFFDAYTRRTSLRYGVEAQTLSPTQRAWQTPAGAAKLTLDGLRVTVLETPRSL
jgi:hypothetical protein